MLNEMVRLCTFVQGYEEKRPLGRPRHRWEDNVKMDIQDVGCGGVWTG